MCTVHWPMVPPALREVISGDLGSCPPAIVTAAIDAVAHHESRVKARTGPRCCGKPVQLALFEV